LVATFSQQLSQNGVDAETGLAYRNGLKLFSSGQGDALDQGGDLQIASLAALLAKYHNQRPGSDTLATMSDWVTLWNTVAAG
jgi:hypothetical protein